MFHMGMAVSSMERNRQKSPIDLEQYINSKIAHLIGATWYLIWNFILLIKSAFPKFWMLYPTQHFHISLFLCTGEVWLSVAWRLLTAMLPPSYKQPTHLNTTHIISYHSGVETKFSDFLGIWFFFGRGGERCPFESRFFQFLYDMTTFTINIWIHL